MSNNEPNALRQQLIDAMSGHNAHIDFNSAVKDFPAEFQGVKPAGAPHSAWELLEHMRIAQWDILEFSRDPKHTSPPWPEGYWPTSAAPPTNDAWEKSVRAFQEGSRQLADMIRDTNQDLLKRIKHGEGQTLLREALLVVNHNSYHLGQLLFLKKMLIP